MLPPELLRRGRFDELFFVDLPTPIERKEIIEADSDTIRSMADIIESVLDQNNICVIGNENKIEEDKHLFKNILNLFD